MYGPFCHAALKLDVSTTYIVYNILSLNIPSSYIVFQMSYLQYFLIVGLNRPCVHNGISYNEGNKYFLLENKYNFKNTFYHSNSPNVQFTHDHVGKRVGGYEHIILYYMIQTN